MDDVESGEIHRLLGHREITLKSDTEPAITAFRRRVEEMCKAEVATAEAVNGDRPSNGLIENTVMLREYASVLPCLVEHAGCILYRCQKDRDGRTLKDCTARNRHNNWSRFVEKVLAKQISIDPMNMSISHASSGFGLDCETTVQNVSFGKADDVFRAREIRRFEPQSRWDKDAVNGAIGVPVEVARRQVRSGQTRNPSGPNSSPAIATKRRQNSEGKHHKTTHRLFGATLRLECNEGQHGHTPTQIVAECGLKTASD